MDSESKGTFSELRVCLCVSPQVLSIAHILIKNNKKYVCIFSENISLQMHNFEIQWIKKNYSNKTILAIKITRTQYIYIFESVFTIISNNKKLLKKIFQFGKQRDEMLSNSNITKHESLQKYCHQFFLNCKIFIFYIREIIHIY